MPADGAAAEAWVGEPSSSAWLLPVFLHEWRRCVGFAQVTLVELRASYKQGCKSNRNNKQQTQTKQPKKPNKKPPGQPLK